MKTPLPEKLPNLEGTVWAEGSVPATINQLIDYLAEREAVEETKPWRAVYREIYHFVNDGGYIDCDENE